MSIPLPPPIGDGFQTSPSSVNYVDVHAKDNLQERTNTGLVHGAPWNPGVILAKDSLEVPLENLFLTFTKNCAIAFLPFFKQSWKGMIKQRREIKTLMYRL